MASFSMAATTLNMAQLSATRSSSTNPTPSLWTRLTGWYHRRRTASEEPQENIEDIIQHTRDETLRLHNESLQRIQDETRQLMEEALGHGLLWTPSLFFPNFPTRRNPTAVAAANEISQRNLDSSPLYRLPTELVEEVVNYLNPVDVYCLGRV
jgi:hypothetical protein